MLIKFACALDALKLVPDDSKKEIAAEILLNAAVYSHDLSGDKPCRCEHQNLCVGPARMILGLSSPPM